MSMKMIALLLVSLFVFPAVAEARRFVAVKDGKEVIAHTSAAPVVVHRILPPYGLGKHVYAGRVDQ